MNFLKKLLFGDIIESAQVAERASTEKLVNHLEEEVIFLRGENASLREQIRLYRAFEVSAESGGAEVDLNTLQPITRRSRPLSMIKARAAQLLVEQQKKRTENAG